MRWLVVAIVIAACGGDDPTPPADSSATPSAEAGGARPSPAADASATTAGDADAGAEPPPDRAPPPEEHEGEATYYAAGTTGACGIRTPSDKLVGALGPALYSKDVCGQCAEVTGPKGTVTVLINDRCAGCKGDSMDLSTQAFTEIATKSQGRVAITWHYVDCP